MEMLRMIPTLNGDGWLEERTWCESMSVCVALGTRHTPWAATGEMAFYGGYISSQLLVSYLQCVGG